MYNYKLKCIISFSLSYIDKGNYIYSLTLVIAPSTIATLATRKGSKDYSLTVKMIHMSCNTVSICSEESYQKGSWTPRD